jgi:hypothetical protein
LRAPSSTVKVEETIPTSRCTVSRIRVVLLSIPALLFLAGADGCPLTISDAGSGSSTTAGGSSTTGASSSLDIGGTSGAYWTVTCEDDTDLVLSDGKTVTSKTATLGGGAVTLGDSTLDLDTFCEGSDAVCPQGVFPSTTAMVQPSTDLSVVVVGFNRTGPFSVWKSAVGLEGVLDGDELSVSLVTSSSSGTSSDTCATRTGSKLVATASSISTLTSGDSAATLDGKVVLIYSGACLALAGGSSVDSAATLQLKVKCVAKRSS